MLNILIEIYLSTVYNENVKLYYRRKIIMNLQKIKELEDLKAKIGDLAKPYMNDLTAIKIQTLKTAKSDFISYFEEQGFKLNFEQFNQQQQEGEKCIASYGSFKIELFIPKVEIEYMGAMSSFTLKTNMEYLILLNESGRKSGVYSTITSAPKNEDEKLQLEIDRVNRDIENIKNDYQTLKENGLTFTFKEKENSNTGRLINQISKEFKTLREILEEVISKE